MLNRKNITVVGLMVLAILLVVGFVEILEKRFAEGGIYPHYASFRPDPLGTSVFYESLDSLEGVQVRRNITHLNLIKDLDEDSVLMLLGYPRESLRELRVPDNSPVLAAVKKGARLVITLNPGLVPEIYRPEEDDWIERRRKLKDDASRKEMEGSKSEEGNESEDENGKDKAKAKGKGKGKGKGADKGKGENDDVEKSELKKIEDQIRAMSGPRLTEEFEFEVASLTDFERPEKGWKTKRGKAVFGNELLEELPHWKSQFRIKTESKAWKQIVKVKKEPVVIEREWGKGSIVFATDSFFLSNEALHEAGSPGLLVWLIGGKRNVVFDETIHGTRESGGAMKLIRRYRLHGFFFGMLIFVGLWAWRSASSLAPGSDLMDRGLISGGSAVSGEHSRSGLVRLIRRSVTGKDLLRRCFQVWQNSQHRELSSDAVAQIEIVLRETEAGKKPVSLVAAYRKISELMKRRWGHGIDKRADKREGKASSEG